MREERKNEKCGTWTDGLKRLDQRSLQEVLVRGRIGLDVVTMDDFDLRDE